MKWMILAIVAEASVLLCLIFVFDGAMHSMATARLTWDHVAVSMVYAFVRVSFSRRRKIFPTRSASRADALPVRF